MALGEGMGSQATPVFQFDLPRFISCSDPATCREMFGQGYVLTLSGDAVERISPDFDFQVHLR